MSALYLLDTNICVHIRRRNRVVLRRMQDIPAASFAISVITLGQLALGRSKSPDPARSQLEFESVQNLLTVLPVPVEAAEHYGDIRALLSGRGEIIGANDLWIAAHARASGLVLVTGNMREFRRVPGLSVEDWTKS